MPGYRSAYDGELKFQQIGMPSYGRYVWLPERKAEYDQKSAERTAMIRKLLGGA
jgi:hypothetical protein